MNGLTHSSWLLLSCSFLFFLAAEVRGQIHYVYDDLGRLVAVVDSAGETAFYSYDAVGNVVSIARQASSQVSILEFTPKSGPPGTAVTVYGTGFSETASENSLSFNGVAASVGFAGPTRIVTTVPEGATTGPIAVIAPGGSDTSDVPFTVVSQAPTITSFTPTSGLPGTAITIDGTNFEPASGDNTVRLNTIHAPVTSASTGTITATAPTASSGRISVATPYGVAESADDFIIPPSPYTVSDIETTARTSIGDTVTVTISTGSKIALVLFDAEAGQRVSIKATDVSIPATGVRVIAPNASTLKSYTLIGSGFVDTVDLNVSGTYTIVLAPTNNNYSGSATLTLYDVPPDVTGSIVPDGTPYPLALSTPGQNAWLTFSGYAGQRISLQTTNGTFPSCSLAVRIYDPLGLSVVLGSCMGGNGFIDTTTLSLTGTYAVLVNPSGDQTGSVTLRLYDVPPDVTGPIVAGGSPVPVTMDTPGQNALLTFEGSAGQRVSLRTTNGTFSSCTCAVAIRNPDGTNLTSSSCMGSSGFLDTKTLASTGTFTVFVNPSGANTGSVTVTLYDVPPDVSGSLEIGGDPVPVTITTPGQNASLTFSGTSGQEVTVRITNNTIGSLAVKLLKPDGGTLTSRTSSSSNFNLTPQTLPSTGTYTITLDPSGASTGSVNTQVTSP